MLGLTDRLMYWSESNLRYCWRKEYDLRCGHPLADATRTGPYTFVRNFTNCDVFVDTDCETCSGNFKGLYGEIRLKTIDVASS
jgi:hypothetical protein